MQEKLNSLKEKIKKYKRNKVSSPNQLRKHIRELTWEFNIDGKDEEIISMSSHESKEIQFIDLSDLQNNSIIGYSEDKNEDLNNAFDASINCRHLIPINEVYIQRKLNEIAKNLNWPLFFEE